MVATPTLRGISPKTATSWIRLAHEARDRIAGIEFDFSASHVIALARGEQAARFLAGNCTHLLQWDDDVAVEPEAIFRLLALDVPCAGAGYRWKHEHVDYAVWLSDQQILQEPRADGTIEARGFGGGMTVWRRDAVEALDRAHGRLAGTGPCLFYLEYLVERRIYVTEDYSSCERWRELSGESPRLLLDVDVLHVDGPHREFPGNYAGDVWSRRQDVVILTGPRPPVPADAPCPCGAAGRTLAQCHGRAA
jgi:hypothetical protein